MEGEDGEASGASSRVYVSAELDPAALPRLHVQCLTGRPEGGVLG